MGKGSRKHRSSSRKGGKEKPPASDTRPGTGESTGSEAAPDAARETLSPEKKTRVETQIHVDRALDRAKRGFAKLPCQPGAQREMQRQINQFLFLLAPLYSKAGVLQPETTPEEVEARRQDFIFVPTEKKPIAVYRAGQEKVKHVLRTAVRAAGVTAEDRAYIQEENLMERVRVRQQLAGVEKRMAELRQRWQQGGVQAPRDGAAAKDVLTPLVHRSVRLAEHVGVTSVSPEQVQLFLTSLDTLATPREVYVATREFLVAVHGAVEQTVFTGHQDAYTIAEEVIAEGDAWDARAANPTKEQTAQWTAAYEDARQRVARSKKAPTEATASEPAPASTLVEETVEAPTAPEPVIEVPTERVTEAEKQRQWNAWSQLQREVMHAEQLFAMTVDPDASDLNVSSGTLKDILIEIPATRHAQALNDVITRALITARQAGIAEADRQPLADLRVSLEAAQAQGKNALRSSFRQLAGQMRRMRDLAYRRMEISEDQLSAYEAASVVVPVAAKEMHKRPVTTVDTWDHIEELEEVEPGVTDGYADEQRASTSVFDTQIDVLSDVTPLEEINEGTDWEEDTPGEAGTFTWSLDDLEKDGDEKDGDEEDGDEEDGVMSEVEEGETLVVPEPMEVPQDADTVAEELFEFVEAEVLPPKARRSARGPEAGATPPNDAEPVEDGEDEEPDELDRRAFTEAEKHTQMESLMRLIRRIENIQQRYGTASGFEAEARIPWEYRVHMLNEIVERALQLAREIDLPESVCEQLERTRVTRADMGAVPGSFDAAMSRLARELRKFSGAVFAWMRISKREFRDFLDPSRAGEPMEEEMEDEPTDRSDSGMSDAEATEAEARAEALRAAMEAARTAAEAEEEEEEEEEIEDPAGGTHTGSPMDTGVPGAAVGGAAGVGMMAAAMAFWRSRAGATSAGSTTMGRGREAFNTWRRKPRKGEHPLLGALAIRAARGLFGFIANAPGKLADGIDSVLDQFQNMFSSTSFGWLPFQAGKTRKDRSKLLMTAEEKAAHDKAK